MSQLSRDFNSDEIPGWEHYSAETRARVAELVRTVLQPMRRRWGTIIITDGFDSRPAHAAGGLDVVPWDALQEGHTLRDVGDWAATYLAASFGELIVEPVPFGGTTTGHLHVTPPGVGSPGRGEYLVEVDHNRFQFGRAESGLLLLLLALAAVLLLALTPPF